MLTGIPIPETMLILLWDRIVETGRAEPIRDVKAVEVTRQIYDFEEFERGPGNLRSASLLGPCS